MKYYYADANTLPVGPLSLEEIRSKVTSGEIPSDPKIKPEGADEWQPLSAFATAGDEPAKPAFTAKLKSVKSTMLSDFITTLLKLSAKVLNPDLLAKTLTFARNTGHYVVLGGAALTLIYSIFAAIKYDSFFVLLTGIGFVVTLAIAQFAAQSFLGAGDKVVANTPSKIATTAFLDCFALLALLLAFAFLFGGLGTAIQTSSFPPFLGGLLGSIFLTSVTALALHPRLINVEIGQGSAGEEAIGLFTFAMKVGLKLIPLFFFLISVLGCLIIIASFTDAGRSFADMASFIPGLDFRTKPGYVGSAAIIYACLVPMLGYILFLVFYLVFDLIRAVLSIPGKLDQLKR